MSQTAYRDFAEGNPTLPLFMRPGWMDAVCGDAWMGLVSGSNDKISGAWALHQRKLKGFKAIVLPPLTPHTGIYQDIDPALQIQKRDLIRQEILEDLIGQIPDTPIFEQKVRFDLKDWSPFYWAGYKQETRYTFRFNSPEPGVIWDNFTKSFRRNIRAAQRKFEIDDQGSLDTLFDLVSNVYDIRGDQMSFDRDTLQRVHEYLTGENCCRILIASDESGPQAAIYLVWDTDSVYYLLGGRSGSNTQSATNLLIWRGIELAAELGLNFDFEGSMIKGVHRFFQQFGATMTPYMLLYRYQGIGKLKHL